MYSNQKIPAPFYQPRTANQRKEKPTGEPPAPQKNTVEKDMVTIIPKEKTVPRKASRSTSALLAVLLFDILSTKEG